MKRKIVSGIVILLAVAVMWTGSARALVSLGSVQLDYIKTASPGGDVVFSVALFNAHGSGDIETALTATGPPGWRIAVPDSVVIPKSFITRDVDNKDGYVVLKTPQGYVNARLVHVRISVPENAGDGVYHIELEVMTREENQSGVGVSQGRKFRFGVDVKGNSRYQGSSGGAQASLDSAAGSEEGNRFVIEEDGNKNKGRTEENKSKKTIKDERSVTDALTGMVSAYPVAPPAILALLLCMLVVLKLLKKL